jgi:hypothetical protein
MLLLDKLFVECISIKDLLHCAFAKKNLVLLDYVGHFLVFFGGLIPDVFRVVLAVRAKRRL